LEYFQASEMKNIFLHRKNSCNAMATKGLVQQGVWRQAAKTLCEMGDAVSSRYFFCYL